MNCCEYTPWLLNNMFIVIYLTITTIQDPISQAQSFALQTIDVCGTDKDVYYKISAKVAF